jgi:hypothetical protein
MQDVGRIGVSYINNTGAPNPHSRPVPGMAYPAMTISESETLVDVGI